METLLFLYVTFGIGYVILIHTLDPELTEFVEFDKSFIAVAAILVVIWPISLYIRYRNDIVRFFKGIGKNG